MAMYDPKKVKVVQPKSVDLGKPALSKVDLFQGKHYLSLRFTWITPEGEVAFTKNGINVQLEYGEAAIQALIDTFNEATGCQLKLVDGA